MSRGSIAYQKIDVRVARRLCRTVRARHDPIVNLFVSKFPADAVNLLVGST